MTTWWLRQKKQQPLEIVKLYEVIKKLACYLKPEEGPIMGKEKKLLTSHEEQEARWVEHFKEVLNRSRGFSREDKPEILNENFGLIERDR